MTVASAAPQAPQVYSEQDLIDIAMAIKDQSETRPCAMTLERMAIRLSDIAKIYAGQVK